MTAPWVYRDPLEAKLTADVSPGALMQHVRTIGSWERESGSPGEAQAFDYIERTLKSYGVEVERREIDAYISLPQQASLTLPDGSVIDGLTHSFSTSVEALDAEVVDVGDGRPEDFKRAAGKIAPGTRFQVSLPTPFATIGARIVPEQVQDVLPAFERHYFREVATEMRSAGLYYSGSALTHLNFIDLAVPDDFRSLLAKATSRHEFESNVIESATMAEGRH